MNYTYILKCADGTLYTGWTNDIEKRIEAHNSGKGAKYTKSRLPVSLFYLEEHRDRKTAMRREVLVNACVRPESRTMDLARKVLEHLDGVVEEVDIEKEKILPLTNKTMEKRQAACDAGITELPMMKYAWQFAEADEIVVAAPYWDLSFPAILKAYFEQITVSGVTFKNMGDGSYKKLCKAEKLYYVMTAGGPVYSPNMGYDYVKTLVSEFYGISDTTLFTAEMLDVDGADVPAIMEKAKQAIDGYFEKQQL